MTEILTPIISVTDEMGRTIRLEFDTDENAETCFTLIANHTNSGGITLMHGGQTVSNFAPNRTRGGQ